MWSVGREATKLRNKRILCSNWTIIVEGSEKNLIILFFVCQNILNWCEIFIVDLAGVYFLKRIFLPPPPCWSIFSSVVIYTKKISGFIHWSMYFWVKISKEKGFFSFYFPQIIKSDSEKYSSLGFTFFVVKPGLQL